MLRDHQLLDRITAKPSVMAGKPVIKGTRLTVDFIINLLAHGATMDEILNEYDTLTPDDVYACLLFASLTLKQTDFMPLVPETV